MESNWKYVQWCIMIVSVGTSTVKKTEDEKVNEYLAKGGGYNTRAEAISNQYWRTSWAYYTNITEYNQDKMTDMSLLYSDFAKNEFVEASKFNLSALTDQRLKRQIQMIRNIGIYGYDDKEVLKRISNLWAEMTGIYSAAKWCLKPEECKPLEPDLTDLMRENRNYDELLEAWKGWRDVSGAKMKDMYAEVVKLLNIAIKAAGNYDDIGAYYRSWYEQDDFEKDMNRLFDQLSPLYDQLHTYVRRKLKDIYGASKFPESGHIPAHLFGDMWSQQWNNIYDLLLPYPGQQRHSLTTEMKNQNYSTIQMFRLAEEFFISIGMEPMSDSFWRLSMLEKPKDDREVVCHASAWDFSNGTDFRIKQCTTVTMEQLITVHHEMGHIQYYIAYVDQPILFRSGANPGFHEGVADIASLSFQTPEHLQKIGLLKHLPNGKEDDINFLFRMALEKVAFLPFGFLVDQWRWRVFRGDITKSNYNEGWWNLRCRYQGIVPPVARSEKDFDPGAKYHIAQNTPYIRYFVSSIAQFQWHKALCELIGQAKQLHRCDIYGSRKAGQRLKEMLQMGSSLPWGKAMETITRGTNGFTDKLSAQPLLDYFKPLQDWLESENNKTGEIVGWNRDRCPSYSFDKSMSPMLELSSLVIIVCIWNINILLFCD